MSIPKDHHYLPQFYLRRWTRGGKLYRYVRPIAGARLHQKRVSPKAVGYEPNLYSYTEGSTEAERQRLETDYFQLIDDRAAVALTKLDAGERGSAIDHTGLVQFVISLLHRSPSRLAYLMDELADRMSAVPGFDRELLRYQAMLKDQINDLLTELISSDIVVPEIVGMKVFRVPIYSKRRLLTCDMPLMLSQGIRGEKAFIMMPYAPDRLVIFAHDERVALAFSTQDHDVLVNGLNDALCRQAREVVISSTDDEKAFIEGLFDPYSKPEKGDGILRWLVP